MNTRQREFIRKWVAALRSRKYKQGTGFLRKSGDKPLHCCLGVACELKGVVWDGDEAIYNGEGHDEVLPGKLRDVIGLSSTDEEDLTHMNDTGKKFYQIARWLERRFLRDPV